MHILNYSLKDEYVGSVMEILKDELRIVFDTNIEPVERYEHFDRCGFNWCFFTWRNTDPDVGGA